MSGYKFLNRWSPKLAHQFAMRRVQKIKDMLTEIGGAYGDVDQGVVDECDRLCNEQLDELIEALDYALTEGFSI